MTVFFETERLIVRQWKDSDKAPFAALNADEEVMRYFPSTLSREKSDATFEMGRQFIDENGFGFFALELKEGGEFIGFTGLSVPGYELPCSPCTEIGWRLDRKFWRCGYASEAASGCLEFAKSNLEVAEIVSFTTYNNVPSQAVMEAIGMTRDLDGDFYHPLLPEGHPLSRHVLYRYSLRQA